MDSPFQFLAPPIKLINDLLNSLFLGSSNFLKKIREPKTHSIPPCILRFINETLHFFHQVRVVQTGTKLTNDKWEELRKELSIKFYIPWMLT